MLEGRLIVDEHQVITEASLTKAKLPRLLERFGKDIRFNCHSTRAKVSRSEASKELQRRGSEAISAIEDRLKSLTEMPGKTPLDQEVIDGWNLLLAWMHKTSE